MSQPEESTPKETDPVTQHASNSSLSNAADDSSGIQILSQALLDVSSTLGELAGSQATLDGRVQRIEQQMTTILAAVTAAQQQQHQQQLENEIRRRMQCEEEIERLQVELARQGTATRSRPAEHSTRPAPPPPQQQPPTRTKVPEEPLDPRWFGASEIGSSGSRQRPPAPPKDPPLSPSSKALAEELRIGQDKEAQDRRTRARKEAAERERAEEEARREEERRKQREKSQKILSVFEFDDADTDDDGLFGGVATEAPPKAMRAQPVVSAKSGLFDDADDDEGGLFDDDERDV